MLDDRALLYKIVYCHVETPFSVQRAVLHIPACIPDSSGTIKMGFLSFMVLSLAVLLSAANGSPPVDQHQLKSLVDEILNRYKPTYQAENQRKLPMFSLVVSIPFNSETNKFDISQVPDAANEVKNSIIGCNVYTGVKVVAATLLKWPDVLNQCPNGNVLWPYLLKNPQDAITWNDVSKLSPCPIREGTADHAEYRTLKNLNKLLESRGKNDLLLIYVYASPCARRCTNISNGGNILNFLKPIKNQKVVFVFSKVFKPRNNNSIDAEDLKNALKQLGETIGLENIFRCDEQKCENCSNKGNVTSWCYVDNEQPGQKAGGKK